MRVSALRGVSSLTMNDDSMTTNKQCAPKRRNMAGLWMVLCCAVPLLLILVLGATGRGAGNLLSTIALLICPLSMIFMMMSGRGCHSSAGEKNAPNPSGSKTL